MRALAVRRITLLVAAAALASAVMGGTATATPPEHCDSEFGDPCKPVFLQCDSAEERTKGKVSC